MNTSIYPNTCKSLLGNGDQAPGTCFPRSHHSCFLIFHSLFRPNFPKDHVTKQKPPSHFHDLSHECLSAAFMVPGVTLRALTRYQLPGSCLALQQHVEPVPPREGADQAGHKSGSRPWGWMAGESLLRGVLMQVLPACSA